MIPKSRYFWPTLLVVVFGVGLGVFYYICSLVSYFSSDQVRQEFESRVGKAVGGRTVIGSINCDLSGLITITDIEVDTLPEHDGHPRSIIKIPKLQFPWAWTDVVFSGRLPIKNLTIYNPTWTVTTQKLEGYFDVFGHKAEGLPIPPKPSGAVNKDGSYISPNTSLGWLVEVEKVKVVDGVILLTGQTGKIISQIGKISFTADGPPFNGISLKGLQATFPGSPLSVDNLQFTVSTDSSGGIFAKDLTANSNLGTLTSSFEYTAGGSQLNLHADGITYNSFAGPMGFLPDLLRNPGETPISFDTKWSDLEFGHPRGTGKITLAPSHLSLLPPMLEPLTHIHGPGGSIDPISGSINFDAFLDMDKQTALVKLQEVRCVLGLPLPPAPAAPAPTTGRHGAKPPPPVTGSALTSLEAVGTGTCDFVAPKLFTLFDAPIKDPTVASLLTTATHAKQKIGDVWTFQVYNVGDLKTLKLETGKPAPPTPPPTTAKPTPTPTPTPAPTEHIISRHRHH